MRFDVLAAGVAAEKIEQQPNEVLLVLWNQLRPDQQFTLIPRKSTTRVVQLADYLAVGIRQEHPVGRGAS